MGAFASPLRKYASTPLLFLMVSGKTVFFCFAFSSSISELRFAVMGYPSPVHFAGAEDQFAEFTMRIRVASHHSPWKRSSGRVVGYSDITLFWGFLPDWRSSNRD